MKPDRSTIRAADGRPVIVERRAIAARGLSAARHVPARVPTLSERLLDVAVKVQRLAGPSRTHPHRFTEAKDELAAEIRMLAGASR